MPLPDLIGPYRPLARIGAGGMGTVFYCLSSAGHPPLAVKVLHEDHAQDLAHRQRFAREVTVLRKVQGRYVVPLVDADPDAGQPWLATPYVPGNTLHQHLRQHGPLVGGSLTTFAAATAHALACIHRAGVAHRDLKPANVILAADGPRVLDFGIAHHLGTTAVTATRMTTGTPGWMAPEQLTRGETVTATDVFAWGMLVCFAATGRHPFGNPTGIDFRIVGDAPDLTGVARDLGVHAAAALDKDPANRPTAAALAEAVAAAHGPTGTRVFPTQEFTRAGAAPTRTPDSPAPLPPGYWTVPPADTDLTELLAAAPTDTAPTRVRPRATPTDTAPTQAHPRATPTDTAPTQAHPRATPTDTASTEVTTEAPPTAPPPGGPVATRRPGRRRSLAAAAGGVTLVLLATGLVVTATRTGGNTPQSGGAPAYGPAPSAAAVTPVPVGPATTPAGTPSPAARPTRSPSPVPTPEVQSLFGGMGITVPVGWSATRDARNDGPAVPNGAAGATIGRYQPVDAAFAGLLIAFEPSDTADRMFPSTLSASTILWAQQDGSGPETLTEAVPGPPVTVGGRTARSWTVRTDVLPDHDGARTQVHRVWWLPAAHVRITTYGKLTAQQDHDVDGMIASITAGPADLPLDCADGVAYLDSVHVRAANTAPAGLNCTALAFGGAVAAEDPGTTRTGTAAACVALVAGYLDGSAGHPLDARWAGDRAGCDLPVRTRG